VEGYHFDNVRKNHTITATFTEIPWQNPFKDVWETDVYYDVKYVCVNGLMLGGDAEGILFGPNETLTRAMLVTILWRFAGSPLMESPVDFCDVPDRGWYSDAIAWASSNGMVLGYGDGTFGPDDPLNREQLAAILYRFECHLIVSHDPWMFPLQNAMLST